MSSVGGLGFFVDSRRYVRCREMLGYYGELMSDAE